MPAIEASKLTKIYRTYRKERGLWGAVKGLGWRRYDETRAADQVIDEIRRDAASTGCGRSEFLELVGECLHVSADEADQLA